MTACPTSERLHLLATGAEEACDEENRHIQVCLLCQKALEDCLSDSEILQKMVAPEGEMDFGDYRCLRPLGEGGMSVVYAAQGRDGAAVAVKVCRSAALLAYFKAEASLMQRCQERQLPGILPLLTADLDHLPPYLVMPLCSGGTLKDRLDKEGGLPARDVWKLTRQLGTALQSLKTLRTVHGDIKPENILFDDRQRAWLSDLGTARRIRIDAAEAQAQMTGTRPQAYTALYMAPEQAREQDLSPAADVFCLGLILYEAAWGSHPYGEGTTWEIVSRMLNGPPSPLRERCPSFPRHLAALIDRCLDPDPRRRPDCGKLAQLPSSYLDPDAWYQGLLRHRKLMACYVAMACALGLAMWIFPQREETTVTSASSTAALPGGGLIKEDMEDASEQFTENGPSDKSNKVKKAKPPMIVKPMSSKDATRWAETLGLNKKNLFAVSLSRKVPQVEALRCGTRMVIMIRQGYKWNLGADWTTEGEFFFESLDGQDGLDFHLYLLRDGELRQLSSKKGYVAWEKGIRCAPAVQARLSPLFPPESALK